MTAATTHRVIYSVHRATAYRRAVAQMTIAAGVTDDDVAMVYVADLADRGAAIARN